MDGPSLGPNSRNENLTKSAKGLHKLANTPVNPLSETDTGGPSPTKPARGGDIVTVEHYVNVTLSEDHMELSFVGLERDRNDGIDAEEVR